MLAFAVRLSISRTRVQFPLASLNKFANMAKWCNWLTRDAQNVVPSGDGSSTLPLATYIAGGLVLGRVS